MKKLNQEGSGLVEALLLVVIAGIIGGTGYYVWHSKQQTDNTLTSAQSENASSSQAKTTKTSGSGAKHYLTISDWDVKMTTSSNSEDAYTVTASDSNSGQFLNIDSHDIDALTASDGSSCKGEYVAIIGKYQKDDPNLNDPVYVGEINAEKSVGNYVYVLTTKKEYAPPCFYDASSTPIEPNTTLYNTKVTAYTTMFDSIQAQ